MNEKLKSIANEYMENVKNVCHLMLKGLNLKSKYDLLKHRSSHWVGEFDLDGNNKYFFHGRGCLFENQNVKINWDFGYGSRWCGLDPWFIANYLKDNNSMYSEFYDGSKIRKEFEQAVINGEMIEKYGQFYFTIPASETFCPDFPKEFDTLVIEHFESRWTIKRNKMVDKFIRKSRWVWKQIAEGPDVYTLKFFLDGKNIFTIPFDDIGYQERAIRIMWELLRDNEEITL